MPHHAGPLETVSVDVPEEAVEVFEAALASACDTVGLFRDHATGTWRVEGVRAAHAGDGGLEAALLLASELSGIEVPVRRDATLPDGWLARSYASFPEQRIGRRFALRGTHLHSPPASGRITLTLDAGLAFGSGNTPQPGDASVRSRLWRGVGPARSWILAPARVSWPWRRLACCGARCSRRISSPGRSGWHSGT